VTSIVDKFQECAEIILGRKLLSVKGVIYVYGTPNYEYPQQLHFVFSKADAVLALECGRDGSSLDIADFQLQDKDLGEYGKEIVMDLSSDNRFASLIDKTLLQLFLIYSSVEDSYIGVKLIFNEGSELFVLNLGDELNVLKFLPDSFLLREGVIYYSIGGNN
jgi:hypothetical protein